ncbi:MAG: PAS domain S-box protein [Nitrospirae bacterium]|nr:PAS domain S-box protein [Nitrospirota bacterium]
MKIRHHITQAKILLVDDDLDLLALLEALLAQQEFHHVRSVSDARKAREVYQEFQPDLVILDLQMPHKDGFVVLTELSTMEGVPVVPIVAITADQQEETRGRALLAGADDFLNKPIHPTELLCRVRNLLEHQFLLQAHAQQARLLEQKVLDLMRTKAISEDHEIRLRNIITHAVDGIVTIDTQGLIESVNPATERLFGYAPSELIGQNVNILMPNPYRDEHDEYLSHYLATGQAKIIGIGREVLGRRKDGNTFPLELSVSEIRIGERRLFTGILRDISRRKHNEAILKEREERMRAIFEQAVDAILTIDERGCIQSFNPAAKKIFGYTAAEVFKQNVKILMPAPYRDEHDEYLAQYLATGQAKVIGGSREVIGRRKDGSTFPMEISVSEARAGNQRLFTGILRDISERKRLQEQVLEQHRALEERVRDRTKDLTESVLEITARLGRTGEYRDTDTGKHVMRIGHFSACLAKHIGQSEDWCSLLLAAAPLHDIGKVGVPDRILLKPGPLSEDEWVVMRNHTRIGSEILAGSKHALLQMAQSIALCHQEKWNGTGYPQGLQGEAIPLEARIVALCDVFDALTTVRPYKAAWAIDDAIEFVRKQSGIQFDPTVVEAFSSALPEIMELKIQLAD